MILAPPERQRKLKLSSARGGTDKHQQWGGISAFLEQICMQFRRAIQVKLKDMQREGESVQEQVDD